MDEDFFTTIYTQVSTRYFTYGLASPSIVPMADNLNHKAWDVAFEVMNVALHPEGDGDGAYNNIGKYLNDHTSGFKNNGWSDDEIAKKKLNIKGRFNHDIYQMN